MTEYGRGQGSEPWHPGDPYYGDDGWGGQHPQGQHQHPQGQQSPYGGQPQQYPEQDPYGQQHQQQYDDGYGQQHQQHHQQQYGGDWSTGQQPQYGAGHDPYGQQQHQQHHPQHQQHQNQHPQQHQQQYDDGYGQQGYVQQGAGRPGPGPDHTDWDAEPQEEQHPFFAGGGDEDDEQEEPRGRRGRGGRSDGGGGRSDRRGRGGGRDEGRKGGRGCLIALLVIGAVVVGGGYYLYQERFAAPPDYSGDGNGQVVTISIPPGSAGAEVGRILKEKGIVKSVDGFVAALTENGGDLQAGAYQLEKEMSAESAVEWLLDPKKSQAKGVVVTEGMRNVNVYAAIDKKLGLDKGATQKIAETKADELGLPEWAAGDEDIKDPLEGFLFPATYPASEDTKPEDLLKDMIKRSVEVYEKHGVETEYKKHGLDSPLELVTVASLVQAEGIDHKDFTQIAEVVYNRLSPQNDQTAGRLEFDSTYNYFKNQTELDISAQDLRNTDHPYNTHYVRGLPPGPIGNPGEEALNGALSPTDKGWYFFVSLDGTTHFTKTYEEHLVWERKFQDSLKEGE
ncbi:endolytic transglycosylase MltG [Streptomyces abyssomicinicus]|uniref:endolytic transglycosylase MltG n=1 Tax=Streptomyces abyssomicinicus TaxID=574929 RepID=UPI00124F95F3|nr:endolytic transglycosylase MltG [Streptomyces abyssomicinicus]